MTATTYSPAESTKDAVICPECNTRPMTPGAGRCRTCEDNSRRKITPRNLEIYRAVEAGATLEAVGRRFGGLSKESVRKIHKNTAKMLGKEVQMPRNKKYDSPSPLPTAPATKRQRKTVEVYARHRGLSITQVMRFLVDRLYLELTDEERAEVDSLISESQE